MRYDLTIVFTQEFSLAVEAHNAAEAQQAGIETMNEGLSAKPDKTDMHIVVEKGVA